VAELTRIEHAPDDEILARIAGRLPLDGRTLARDSPDETWMLRDAGGEASAHGSIWWRDAPQLPGRRTGIVGHYAASDAASAGHLLDHLCRRLATEGCDVAVGPMDGNTWRRYRFAVHRGEQAAFFMDVENPAEWPAHFRASGFAPIAEYSSTVVDDIASHDPRVPRVGERLDKLGVRIRELDQAHLDDDLRAIHLLSLRSFHDAFLYTPISESEFLSLYRPLLPRVDPRLVLLAHHEDRLAGYVFTVPDLNERARGAPLRTLVVKTLAVLPDRAYAGLGALLLARVHEHARQMGLDRAIHALMHVSNQSRALSGHWQGREICRYELYGRELTT
jgi:GNAT superfamily N-acetyltransferase